MIGKNRLSPSKATWCKGNLVDTPYESSCARYVVWERRFEKEAKIDPLYKTIGDIDEALYAARLTAMDIPFTREVEFTHPIAGSSVTIEGRYDFRLELPAGPVLVEKKSVTSANRNREIVVKGHIDEKQLAQLVTYMAVQKITTGQLVCTHWKWADDLSGFVTAGERTFDVSLTPQGMITVDGLPFSKHLRDLQSWFRIVSTGMENADQVLPDRPMSKPAWQNPCHKCPLADACTRYDSSRNVAQFWQETQRLEPRDGVPAQIIAPKIKKGRKNEQDSISDSSHTDDEPRRIRDKSSEDEW